MKSNGGRTSKERLKSDGGSQKQVVTRAELARSSGGPWRVLTREERAHARMSADSPTDEPISEEKWVRIENETKTGCRFGKEDREFLADALEDLVTTLWGEQKYRASSKQTNDKLKEIAEHARALLDLPETTPLEIGRILAGIYTPRFQEKLERIVHIGENLRYGRSGPNGGRPASPAVWRFGLQVRRVWWLNTRQTTNGSYRSAYRNKGEWEYKGDVAKIIEILLEGVKGVDRYHVTGAQAAAASPNALRAKSESLATKLKHET